MKLRTKVAITSIVFVALMTSLLTSFQLGLIARYSDRAVTKAVDDVSAIVLQQLEVRAGYTADYLSKALVNPVYRYDLEGVYRLLSPALQHVELEAAVVFDPNGHIIHSGNEQAVDYGNVFSRPEIIEHVVVNRSVFESRDAVSYEIAHPLYIGSDVLGGLYLRYSLVNINQKVSDVENTFGSITDQAETRITRVAILVAIVLVLLASLISIVLAQRLLAPINALAEQARRISLGADDVHNTIERTDELGELACSLNDMVQTLRKRTEVIEFLAYNDHLTRLPNRTQFMDDLNNAVLWAEQNATELAVYFIDLDEFKGVNDNYGHHVGDSLLIEISQRMKALVLEYAGTEVTGSKIEPLLARVGGDEFLLLTAVPKDKALSENLAERILALLDQPLAVGNDGDTVVVKASIGVAHYYIAGRSAGVLIRNADIAMYAAKAAGKHTYCVFTEDMAEHVQRKAVLERELRKVLASEDPGAELALWVQPQIDLSTGKLAGAEALIRWNHPEKGLILPSEFIPVAESTGLILPIGEFIIEQACILLSLWQSKLPADFHLSINLSVKQFYRQALPELFDRYLDQYVLPPSLIHLEVTESLLMRNEFKAKENLDALKAYGFELWLDDFGVGYSSLSYLQEFQIDGLKIDRGFVSGIDQDPEARRLCTGILLLAEQLGLRVVAEGVERQDHVEFLQSHHCDMGQGYYFSKPLTATEFERQYLVDPMTLAHE